MRDMQEREVSIEEAQKIWDGKCPVCGGNLQGAPDRSGAVVCLRVICEFGCKAFKVPPKPALPQRM